MELNAETAAKFRQAIGKLKVVLEEADQAAKFAKEAAAQAAKEADEAKQRQAEAEGMDQAWSTLEKRLGLSSSDEPLLDKLETVVEGASKCGTDEIVAQLRALLDAEKVAEAVPPPKREA